MNAILSETGKSIYVCGETKQHMNLIKGIKNTAFCKWNAKKQCWNLVPKKGKMDDVTAQVMSLIGGPIKQAHQVPEVSANVAWVEPPPKPKSVQASEPKSKLKLKAKLKAPTSSTITVATTDLDTVIMCLEQNGISFKL